MTKLTWSSPKLTVRMLTITAILVAIQVVLSKISIGSDSLVKISLGFIATALVGYFLGPWLGGIALVLNDLIANTLLSTGSSFFIGFTFSAFISGVIAGAFLRNQPLSWQRLAIYELVQILVTNVFFTTLWIHVLYTTPFNTLLLVRLPKEIISWPIETLVIVVVLQAIAKHDFKLDRGY